MKKQIALFLGFILLATNASAFDTIFARSKKFIYQATTITRRNSTLEQQLIGFGNLTFFKDFAGSQDSINADYSVGSPTGTFTASRGASNPATYVDASGIVQTTTTSNAARFCGGFFNATTGFVSRAGLMIEGAATNIFVSGSMDSNSAVSAATGTANVTYSGSARWVIAVNAAAATSNSISTDSNFASGRSAQINITTAGTQANHVQFDTGNNVSITNGTAYTLSFWVKTSASKTIPILCYENGGAFTIHLNSTFDTVANTWVRVQIPFTGAITAASAVEMRLGNNGLYTFNIEGLQLETGSFATSFIPTTAASLTRNAETLTYPIASNRTAATETMFNKVNLFRGGTDESTSGQVLSSTDTKDRLLYVAKAAATESVIRFSANITDNPADAIGASTLSKNTSYVITAVAEGPTVGTNATVYKDGVSDGTNTTNYTAPAWGTNFYIGVRTGGTLPTYAIFQSLAIYSDAKSSGDVSSISTLLSAG